MGGRPIRRTLRYSGCAVTHTKRNVGYVASVKQQSQTACPSHFEEKQDAQDENRAVRRPGDGGYTHRPDARNGAGILPQGLSLGPSSSSCLPLGPLKIAPASRCPDCASSSNLCWRRFHRQHDTSAIPFYPNIRDDPNCCGSEFPPIINSPASFRSSIGCR